MKINGDHELNIEQLKVSDVLVLRLYGEFDYDTSQDFRKFTGSLPQPELSKVVINFSGIEWLDSSALSVLTAFLLMVRRLSGRIFFSNLSERTKEVLRLSNLIMLVATAESEAAALSRLTQ
ncbi:MAG: STAS domain-containing protein [Candidatus Wallbacteria bacterium]|nr:STAS domain-containing protein [Candidatus Wallbacteria bacterium]